MAAIYELSKRRVLSSLDRAADLLDRMSNSEGENRNWRKLARDKQQPPAGDDWLIWMLMAGRGFGKTWTGANWILEQALAHPDSEWAIIAPTFRDVRKTCIEESSGVLHHLQPGELVNYRRNELQIMLSNGATIYGYSADQPERIRGANLWGAWCEELGSWRYEETWHEGLIPALRKGERPRVIVTTTPRPTKLIKYLVKLTDGSVHITRGSTWENRAHLSEAALKGLEARYGGTRLGRQELEGELLEDIEGALWKRGQIDEDRLRHHDDVPDLVRVVVGIDPAVTSKAGSDEYGIVICGMDATGHGYVLGDYSMSASPNTAIRRAIQGFNAFNGDLLVGEVNNGGDWIETAVRAISHDVPFKAVRATRGKLIRAEPVSALYEQHRIHHVGSFPELEDQMCDWTPLDLDSPDRMDALVWAFTEMFQLGGDSWSGMYGHRKCPQCERGFMPVEGRTRCPHCQHPIEGAVA